jgi:hypothetical protein
VATHLIGKLDAFCDRHAQAPSVLAFAGRVIEGDPFDHPQRLLAMMDNDLFLLLHALEGGLLVSMLDAAGEVLPGRERAVLESWRNERHRYVELLSTTGRRARFVEVVTGAVLDVDTPVRHDSWEVGERGFAAIVPVGARLVLVGEPMVVPPEHEAEASAAVASLDRDPDAVADLCLRWLHDEQVALAITEFERRVRFVFPDLDPHGLDWSEEGLLALVKARRPDAVEWEQLIEAIVASRIITLRTPHTWARAEAYLAAGASREFALAAVTYETQAEICERAATEDAA